MVARIHSGRPSGLKKPQRNCGQPTFSLHLYYYAIIARLSCNSDAAYRSLAKAGTSQRGSRRDFSVRRSEQRSEALR
jgi:hypothetical protein